MLPVLQIGPLALQTPGLLILLGIWAGLWAAEKFALRSGQDNSKIYNLAMVGLVSAVIGARLAMIARFPQAFSGNLWSILALNPALMDWQSGLLVGVLAGLIYAQRKNISLWPALDALTPGIAIFMIASGLAHFASGEAYGKPTNLPWAIQLWGQARHPSQIYEILLAVGIAYAVWVWQKRSGKSALRPAGRIFLGFVALSAGARLFLEAFRGDSILLFDNFRLAQVAAWIILAISLWILRMKWRSTEM